MSSNQNCTSSLLIHIRPFIEDFFSTITGMVQCPSSDVGRRRSMIRRESPLPSFQGTALTTHHCAQKLHPNGLIVTRRSPRHRRPKAGLVRKIALNVRPTSRASSQQIVPAYMDTPPHSIRKSLPYTNSTISEQRSLKGQERPSSSVWDHLLVYMPYNTPKPSNPLTSELLSLTQLRLLPYRFRVQLAGGYPSLKTLFVLFVYLTGRKAQEPSQPCKSTDKSATLPRAPGSVVRTKDFPESIMPSSMASAGLKKVFGVNRCCNEFYSAPVEVEGLPAKLEACLCFSSRPRTERTLRPPSLSALMMRRLARRHF